VLGSVVLGEVITLTQGHLRGPATRKRVVGRGNSALLAAALLTARVFSRLAMTTAVVFPGRAMTFYHSLIIIDKLFVSII
jgi:hypothetical protein